jgi:hypothetical protein
VVHEDGGRINNIVLIEGDSEEAVQLEAEGEAMNSDILPNDSLSVWLDVWLKVSLMFVCPCF